MKKGRSTGKPTKAEAARFCSIHAVGCIACLKNGNGPTFPQIHHLTVGGKHGQKRRGHRFTIGLCDWHHVGIHTGLYTSQVEQHFGPSYAISPRKFREYFGSDDELLAMQDELIGWKDE